MQPSTDHDIRYNDLSLEPPQHRYGWTVLLYASFAAFIALLFLLVR